MIEFEASSHSLTGTGPQPGESGGAEKGASVRASLRGLGVHEEGSGRMGWGEVGEGKRGDAAPAFPEERAMFTYRERGRLARAPAGRGQRTLNRWRFYRVCFRGERWKRGSGGDFWKPF